MLLAVDVGNTNITFGVYDGEKLIADWRISSDVKRTSDEYAIIIKGLLDNTSLSVAQLDGFALCSVIPRTIAPLLEFAKKYLKIKKPFLLTPEADLGIQINYEPKTDVGADRLANAVAAHALYKGSVIVVDLGTATTFDAISANGDYLGGAIAPGIEISIEALVAKAAQLRRVQFVTPPNAIGSTTVTSLQSGVVYGFAGQVDRIVEQFQEELGGNARVVATGGLAELIAPHSRAIQEINLMITLEGLRLAYERSRTKD